MHQYFQHCPFYYTTMSKHLFSIKVIEVCSYILLEELWLYHRLTVTSNLKG